MIGIISALGATLSWTYACFIWRSQTNKFRILDINLIKNIIAFLIFLPALLNLNIQNEFRLFILLLISGAIGIGLGDTFYLKSLQMLGTRKTLSIETLSPLLASLFGQFFINENLSIKSWIGIFIVSLSLLIILRKKNNLKIINPKIIPLNNNHWIFLYPFLSILCAVSGGLLSRIVFLEANISPFLTTEIRLLGSIIFLIVVTKLNINFFLKKLEKNEKIKFIFSIFLGTNIGILLQQIVFKTLPIGIGWTLLSISPIISLIFAHEEEKEISKEIIFFTISLLIGLCLIIL